MFDQAIDIVIRFKNEAEEALNETQEQLKKLELDTQKLTKAGRDFVIVGGAIKGALALTIKSAQDSEVSWRKVGQEIKLAGLNMEDSMPKIKTFAAAMQNVTGISDEMVGEFVGRMLPITKDVGLAMKATQIAMDMAAGTGRDFESMQVAMTMALSGNIEALRRYVPEIRGLSEEEMKNMSATEKVNFALQALEKQFGGMAQASANPFMILKATLNDLFETIGKLLLPSVTQLALNISNTIKSVINWINENKELATTIVKVVSVIGSLLLAAGTVMLVISKLSAAMKLFGITSLAAQGTVGLIIAGLLVAIGLIIAFKDQIAVAMFTVRGWGLEIEAATERLLHHTAALQKTEEAIRINDLVIQDLKKHIADSKNKTDELSDSNKTLDEMLKNVKVSAKDMGGEMKSVLGLTEDKFKEVLDAAKDLRDKMADINKDLVKIDKDYNKDSLKNQEEYEESVAKLIAETQQKKQELEYKQWEAKQRGDMDEVNDLARQIAEQESILTSYANAHMNIDNQVAEYSAYIRMNEFQQLQYDYQKKQLERERDMLQEKLAKLQELKDATDQYNAIINMFGKEKAEFVKKEIEKSKTFKEKLDEQYANLKNWADAAVAVYRNLAAQANAAISSIGSGRVVSGGAVSPSTGYPVSRGYQEGTSYVPATGLYMLHQGEQVIPKDRVGSRFGGIVVNINGGTYLSQEVAEAIGDKIIDKLRLQFNV